MWSAIFDAVEFGVKFFWGLGAKNVVAGKFAFPQVLDAERVAETEKRN
ncbi:MAG: hypothetical protein ABFC77_14310 [Thermoguttaceae bacterium]